MKMSLEKEFLDQINEVIKVSTEKYAQTLKRALEDEKKKEELFDIWLETHKYGKLQGYDLPSDLGDEMLRVRVGREFILERVVTK